MVSSESPSDFSNQVNDMIKKGWQPIGGVCYDSLSTHYIQSLVRYDEQ
jgi:hypothetical protein